MKAFLFKYKIFITLFVIIALSFGAYLLIEENNTTNNAFVMANIRKVSANVPGHIKQIYVTNGESVEKGQKLFSLDPEPYKHKLDQARARLQAARSKLEILQSRQVSLRDRRDILQEKYDMAGIRYNDAKVLIQSGAISLLKSQKFKHRYYESWLKIRQTSHKLERLQHQIARQKNLIDALQAKKEEARYRLEQTSVRAESDGYVANLFTTAGTSIDAREPVFSFVDTSQWYVQANFEETDLAGIQAGDKADIRIRSYLGEKVYHGEVVSTNWAVNRQQTNSRNFLQHVKKENHWVLLPQRLPVLIRINDYDPDYPLHVGASAYVTIET